MFNKTKKWEIAPAGLLGIVGMIVFWIITKMIVPRSNYIDSVIDHNTYKADTTVILQSNPHNYDSI